MRGLNFGEGMQQRFDSNLGAFVAHVDVRRDSLAKSAEQIC